MKAFITKLSVDSLKFIIPFLLGAFVFSYFGIFGLIAGVMALLLINYIYCIWSKKNKKSKTKIKKEIK